MYVFIYTLYLSRERGRKAHFISRRGWWFYYKYNLKGKVMLSKVSLTRKIRLCSYSGRSRSRKGQEVTKYALATNIIGNTLISHARSFIMRTRSSRTLITFTVCFCLFSLTLLTICSNYFNSFAVKGFAFHSLHFIRMRKQIPFIKF